MITHAWGSDARVRAFRRWLLVHASLMLAVLLICGAAHAHATLTGSMPADGTVLEDPPAAVTLSFNEPVSLIGAMLIAPGGDTVELAGSASTGEISIDLPTELGQGSHAVSWRAVSEDGHPISGTTFFVVGAPSTDRVADRASLDAWVAGLLWLARLVLFIGIFFGVGGAAFRILAELPRTAARFACWASVAGLVAIPAIFGVQGVDLLGRGLSGLLAGQAWELAMASPYSATLALAAAALGLSLLSLALSPPVASRVIASIAVLLVGLGISASGHASAAEPRWLTRAALFMHVTTIAWWVGALLPLVFLLRQSPQVSAPPLLRFSRAIPFAIVPLVASGAALAVIQLGPPGASWWTPYGQVLAAKLILLVALFSIASWNRWVLTEPAAAGDDGALSHMRRGIAAEIVIILAVLGLVSVWRFTPPPRALVTNQAAQLTLELSSDTLSANLTLSSGRVGETDVQISIRSAGGETLSPRAITLEFEPEGGTISPIVRSAEAAPDGIWRLQGLNLPLPGSWQVELQVRVSDFELAKLSGQVEIAP
ncbi:copper resistance CopC/CopD family protein [Devosia submarina]|uniref:copper resistance CopC/CopD family protein n=1 Tax=Devosia submarina TaxID=1173082 RepID=UPI0013005C2A|nr:copper resistance protein CopC [Devosia submarina]